MIHTLQKRPTSPAVPQIMNVRINKPFAFEYTVQTEMTIIQKRTKQEWGEITSTTGISLYVADIVVSAHHQSSGCKGRNRKTDMANVISGESMPYEGAMRANS